MAEAKRGGRGHGPQGHGFQRPKDFRGTVKKLLAYIGRYKASLVLVFICLVISSVGSVMSSYLLKPIINDYILPGDFTGLLKMLALLLGLFLLSGLCSYAYARIMVHISQQTVAQLRQDLFDKLQSLPLRYFDTHQSGDLMSRFTNDMDTVSEMINSSFASVVSCALTFIGIVAMMLYMNWLLTLITFAFLVLMLLVVKGVGGRSRVSFQAQQQALGAMNGYIEEMVEGQKVIKVFNHEGKAIEQFAGLNTAYQTAATAAQTYSGAMMPAMANLSRIDYAVTCCVGGLLAIGGMFDVGSLGAYLLYVKQVSQPIAQISQQVNVLLAAIAGAERIFLRGGPAVWRNTVFQNKCVEAERIEAFRNHAAFVRGAGMVAAAREDDDTAAHFVAGQEIGREIGLERICFAGSGLAVAPQHHFLFKFHRRDLRSW